MEIRTHGDDGYVLEFYDNPKVTFDTDKDTVEISIVNLEKLLKIRDKINEIVNKEYGERHENKNGKR